MKDDWSDKKMKDLFQDMRLQDAERAPRFERLAAVPDSQKYNQGHIPVLRYAMVFLAMIALCLSALFYHMNSNQPQPQKNEQEKWTSFSNWQATTDNLLTMSGIQTETTFSTTTDSWLEDSVISETED